MSKSAFVFYIADFLSITLISSDSHVPYM